MICYLIYVLTDHPDFQPCLKHDILGSKTPLDLIRCQLAKAGLVLCLHWLCCRKACDRAGCAVSFVASLKSWNQTAGTSLSKACPILVTPSNPGWIAHSS